MNSRPRSSRDTDAASPFTSRSVKRSRVVQKLLDRAAAGVIAVGGLGVIATVLLIAFYLVYEVVPLFERARIEHGPSYAMPLPEAGASIYLATEEYGEMGFRLTRSGLAVFFELASGKVTHREVLPIKQGVQVTSLARDVEQDGNLALGLSDGSVLLLRYVFPAHYPAGKRVITPVIEYPFGNIALALFDGAAVTTLGMAGGEDGLLLLAQAQGKSRALALRRSNKPQSGPLQIEQRVLRLPQLPSARSLLVSPDRQWVFLLDDSGDIQVLKRDLADGFSVSETVVPPAPVQAFAWLLGGQSLISLDRKGDATQWFMLLQDRAGERQFRLQPVRQFDGSNSPSVHLAIEQQRKGFLTLDAAGTVSIYHATAGQRVLQEPVADSAVRAVSLSPRANLLLLETSNNQLDSWRVVNKHPEISLSSLWDEVWYEGYSAPEYRWQSSAADVDFEAKLSLVPLVFGTLKAAFYAMLIATPLALCGAIFTAYFMAPAMRARVKPLIELMEALPTVILGFLAGLWLAPLLQVHMIGVILLVLLLPVASLVAAYSWHCLPIAITSRVADGWQAAMLVPVILLTAWFCFLLAPGIERSVFAGNFIAWLTQDLGVGFDQRNALVVGIAMGFAVIPTVFSIAEDAIFSVPKHLTMGSLALGAQPWQTLVGVVLPTASPGIFSALMIGFGRAVGETMIVLMATGNTPIMDWNIFEGMRTLAANIAVEVPEAEVGSSHYRILFLAGLVLFSFTFAVNTVAEVVRQRLRERYGNI